MAKAARLLAETEFLNLSPVNIHLLEQMPPKVKIKHMKVVSGAKVIMPQTRRRLMLSASIIRRRN